MAELRVSALLVPLVLAAALPSAATTDADPCLQGRQLYLENNYLAAEPLLRQCLEQGESLLALLPLTMMTVIQQRVEDGLAFGARALAIAPENVNAIYWYGRALLLAGRQQEALAHWEKGLSLDAGHAGLLEGLARLSLQQGEVARAYNLLRQMNLQGVAEPWLHRMLADLARRKGHWSEAAEHWREVVAREGATEANVQMQGELLILAGKPDAAAAVFRQAIASQPTAAMYGGLGEALFTMERLDSALVALERAVALDPETPRYRFNLANVLQLSNRHAEAGENFRAFLQQRPDDPVGRFHYAVHLDGLQQTEAALQQLETAVRLDPTYVEARVVLAQLYADQGRAEEALAQIEELARLDPGSAAELDLWRNVLQDDLAGATTASREGKVRLQHIVVADPQSAATVRQELAAGAAFADLAARYSLGATAVRGGDIGWVDPAQMVADLREVIERLSPGETSPPVETGGQIHFFRRVR